ncbi:MAG: hypothetical protein HUJ22_12870 [Gracilimonas sp.]|uniref:hypothetical protein n=1 Tax=Gracilimonas sp. TaxID=1974203 RepID=UPI0019A531F1|nr:hypothetical protein [Gracilimonas sp.]MBD3617454.1 hypothetical protein [Gracilimonas sp.]
MKWIERIYSETDFGKSVATTIAGIIGLIIYIKFNDWVIAAFSLIISFPLFRLIASHIHKKIDNKEKERQEKEKAKNSYKKLSDIEKEVVKAFVENGSCVMTWSQFNQSDLPSSGIESLIQRGILNTSMTADGMKETFVLEESVFDAANSQQNKIK